MIPARTAGKFQGCRKHKEQGADNYWQNGKDSTVNTRLCAEMWKSNTSVSIPVPPQIGTKGFRGLRKGTERFYSRSCSPKLSKMVNKLFHSNQWNKDFIFSLYVLSLKFDFSWFWCFNVHVSINKAGLEAKRKWQFNCTCWWHTSGSQGQSWTFAFVTEKRINFLAASLNL